MSDTILRRSPVAPAAGAEGDPRPRLRTMWAAVAPAWAEHADYAEARGADLGERMLTATSPQPGERVLELACGPGGLGLAAAERVAPGGTVVLSDVVAEMTSIAAARASARGITNVSTRQLDLEQIDEPDEVLRRRPLSRGADVRTRPGSGGAGDHPVLRPGGRLAVSVWGPATSNPWLTDRLRRRPGGDGHDRAATRSPRTVLARRPRAARQPLCRRRGGRHRERRRGGSDARSVVRRLVGEDVRARGPAGEGPGVTSPTGPRRDPRACPGSGAGLRATGAARASRSGVARLGQADLAPRRLPTRATPARARPCAPSARARRAPRRSSPSARPTPAAPR